MRLAGFCVLLRKITCRQRLTPSAPVDLHNNSRPDFSQTPVDPYPFIIVSFLIKEVLQEHMFVYSWHYEKC